MRRPRTHQGDVVVTTPAAATMIALLGGLRMGAVALSKDEQRALRKLYGVTKEPPNQKPPPPPAPNPDDFPSQFAFNRAVENHREALRQHEAWVDPQPLYQAGADRNMMRAMETDGLRMVAWIARYLEPGADPVRLLVQLAIDAGCDVDPVDVDWAEEGEDA